jgi:hypothetical protein
MADEKKAKKPKAGLGDEIAAGVVAVKTPGYAAYRREAVAMGDEPLTAEEWAAQQKRKR